MGIAEEIKGSFQRGGAHIRLIYFNLAIFLAYHTVRAVLFLLGIDTSGLTGYLAVPAHLPSLAGSPWTLFTYMFFHQGLLHILFNLLWLYWFGQIFLTMFSGRRMVGVYLMGGLAGAFLYILFYNIFPAFQDALPQAVALGASASVMAIVLAATAHAPNYTINLLLIGPVRIKYIALVVILLDVISIAGPNAGGHIAHLGGAMFGYLYALALRGRVDLVRPATWVMEAFTPSASRKRSRMRVEHSRPLTDLEYNRIRQQRQAEIDRILEKISRVGYGGLTAQEKETLFRMKDNQNS